jgi:hypothetical protein
MTARHKRKESPKQQEANLGQKEARQQERTDAALSRMGEKDSHHVPQQFPVYKERGNIKLLRVYSHG